MQDETARFQHHPLKNTLAIDNYLSINLSDKRNVKLNLANNRKMCLPPKFWGDFPAERDKKSKEDERSDIICHILL